MLSEARMLPSLVSGAALLPGFALPSPPSCWALARAVERSLGAFPESFLCRFNLLLIARAAAAPSSDPSGFRRASRPSPCFGFCEDSRPAPVATPRFVPSAASPFAPETSVPGTFRAGEDAAADLEEGEGCRVEGSSFRPAASDPASAPASDLDPTPLPRLDSVLPRLDSAAP